MSFKEIKLHPHQIAALNYLKSLPKKLVFDLAPNASGQPFTGPECNSVDAGKPRPLIVKPKHTKKK